MKQIAEDTYVALRLTRDRLMDATNDLFQLNVQYFQALKTEFARYGLCVKPELELRSGEGLLCYYDFSDGNIYLSLPDNVTSRGKLQLLVLRSLFNCATNDEVLHFLSLISYWLISHEMAHHLRHAYGVIGTNLWQEEHIANRLAIAVVKRNLSPQQRAECQFFLQRALTSLSEKIGVENTGSDSYYNLLYSFNATGTIDESTLHQIEIIQKFISTPSEDILKSVLQLPVEIIERIQKRQIIIENINSAGNKDLVRYLYYYLSWMNLGLSSSESHFISEFGHRHLNQQSQLLRPNISNTNPTDAEIVACFSAYKETLEHSKTIGLYFYKRYRTLLINKLKTVRILSVIDDTQSRHMYQFLENWDYQGVDPLNYLVNIVSPDIQRLFPRCIYPDAAAYAYLSDTDTRLKNYAQSEGNDLAAANSVQRLELFDKIDFYHLLSDEGLLELTQTLYPVRLSAGQTLIWQGDNDNDVFVLTEGKLEVLMQKGETVETVRVILPGELIGEIAYFTRTKRSATVRALEDSECYVMKFSDLYLFCQEHPAFTLQMANHMANRFRQ